MLRGGLKTWRCDKMRAASVYDIFASDDTPARPFLGLAGPSDVDRLAGSVAGLWSQVAALNARFKENEKIMQRLESFNSRFIKFDTQLDGVFERLLYLEAKRRHARPKPKRKSKRK